MKILQVITLWFEITDKGQEFNHMQIGHNPLLFWPTPMFDTQKGWNNKKWQPKKAYLLFNYHVIIFFNKDGYET